MIFKLLSKFNRKIANVSYQVNILQSHAINCKVYLIILQSSLDYKITSTHCILFVNFTAILLTAFIYKFTSENVMGKSERNISRVDEYE